MLARIFKKWKAFRRARSGAAALEFAIVILPFFLLTIGLAEISMIGFAQTSLDYAVCETARRIRTGQAQMGGMSEGAIKGVLCTEMNRFLVLTCDGNLYLDVRQFNSFVAAGNVPSPIQNDEFQPTGMGYSPGQPSSIVVVRA